MRVLLASAICLAMIGALALSSPAAAKTAKECQSEWRANKAANEKAGVKEKDYVAKCRGEAATETKAKPTKEEPTKATEKKPEAAGAKKTVKACQEEWRANKAANEKAGITEKSYVEKCRAGETIAQPGSMPAPTAPAKEEKASTPAAPARTAAPEENKAAKPMAPQKTATPAPATGQPSGANQYAAEAQAKSHCPGGTVVWANLDSKIYHFEGHNDYGHTKKGAYMCEKDAESQGMRAAKNEKHP